MKAKQIKLLLLILVVLCSSCGSINITITTSSTAQRTDEINKSYIDSLRINLNRPWNR